LVGDTLGCLRAWECGIHECLPQRYGWQSFGCGMKFSIITCTLNSAATVGETIASVLRQTHTDFEYIFVDGGSTDATLDIIERKCPTATVLHGVRGGISRAMNAGLDVAKGEVIAHLHSDDYYAGPDVLVAVDRALTDSGRLWACGEMDLLRDGKRTRAMRRPLPFTGRRYAMGSVTIFHPTVFITRELFRLVGGFDERLRFAMDIDLWLRIGALCTPVEINRPLTVFRQHSGSVSTANLRAARAEEFMVRKRYARRWPLETAIYSLRHWRRMRRLAAPA